jgi:hypothetical protein
VSLKSREAHPTESRINSGMLMAPHVLAGEGQIHAKVRSSPLTMSSKQIHSFLQKYFPLVFI